jgi:beta-phosphoglucomutase-like phosphatase (HAD superfamily)
LTRIAPGPIELVIFDCDGVLIDSEHLAVGVDLQVLGELGWPVSRAEVIERFVGRSDRETQAEIEAHLGRRLPIDWRT